ncbi:DUF6691 family protein [Aquabacter sp. P-9]|uniref:DUF6691 family protein n=1 Tax=Aquabacter sediminis TaxID=3029197 RepID=UPI00237EB3D6|nr:DUF6691 family protein [Aquabacter sp. P-9]MDE1570001.1 YeeE/YedE family protein [Aquabacter sp. P-9]
MIGLGSLLAGLLFGAGLALSGMLDPAKVLNFLDMAGQFDPSLAVTMAAAVTVAFLGFQVLRGWSRPVFAGAFSWPTATDITPRLVIGAALFGLGWGLAGICPGPAIASLALLNPAILAFLVPMFAGMALAHLAVARWPRITGAAPAGR